MIVHKTAASLESEENGLVWPKQLFQQQSAPPGEGLLNSADTTRPENSARGADNCWSSRWLEILENQQLRPVCTIKYIFFKSWS